MDFNVLSTAQVHLRTNTHHNKPTNIHSELLLCLKPHSNQANKPSLNTTNTTLEVQRQLERQTDRETERKLDKESDRETEIDRQTKTERRNQG